MRKQIIRAALLAAATFGMAGSANAQMAVVDVKSIAQALQTAKNTLNQLNEAKKLYTTMNSLSEISNVAQSLQSQILQTALPDGIQDSINLISGNLQDLGAIGNRAQSIMDVSDFSLDGIAGGFGNPQDILTGAATRGARDQAYSEYMLEATAATGDGLKQLSDGLATSTTARQSQDIAARAVIENAQVNNRLLQLQAAQEAARATAALRSSSDFAASQRRTQQNIEDGSLWPTWSGQ
ncbi:type IV secretion system protein [Sphingobium sp. AN641]|jgi:hypothetical protein|uniref:type IV secretion system protein n=1 Tax=Sphingobium sp. AN641 TaxID=3133443 RepID=UPI0030C2F2D9